MAKCSFGKVVVNEVFVAQRPFGTDLEGTFLYVQDRECQWLLASFDFSWAFTRTRCAWRKAVADAVGIPAANIWFHDTQSHSAPEGPELDGEPSRKLIALCLPVIRDMISCAEEAEISYVITDLGTRFNMNREQYIPELGAVTVWVGCEFDEDGKPYCRDPQYMLLEDWKPGVLAFQDKIYFDRPADPQGALLVFRATSGRILGTLTRFAAHADIVGSAIAWANKKEEEHYHFDWPGYVRNFMNNTLGGIGLCVHGPCGNLSPKKELKKTYREGDIQARRIGEGIAAACLDEWKKNASVWEPLRLGKVANAQVDLPLRETIPETREALKFRTEHERHYREAFKQAISSGAPPVQIKRLIDEFYYWSCMNLLVEKWVNLSEDELNKRMLDIELGALRLNDLVLAALPGESLTETCQWLKAQSIGNKLIVFDQINGYAAYLVTPEQYVQGGYSYWASCLARDAEPNMRRKALQLIREAAE